MNTLLPLSLIVACAENRVIGIDNSMPWHLPGDFKYFKATTLGKPIIMGRKTWDSLGRPLPGRLNIVVSRQPGLELAGAEVFASLEEALVRADQWAREQGVDELMLIGGARGASSSCRSSSAFRSWPPRRSCRGGVSWLCCRPAAFCCNRRCR